MVTFGGMWRWRRVAVARVFALVVRCRILMLLLYSRVGKNRDTRRGSPAGAGAGRTADHSSVLFSQNILAVRKANDIYRPVSTSSLFNLSDLSFQDWNVFFYSSPYHLNIYTQIVVNELISHSSNHFPRDFKIYLLCI